MPDDARYGLTISNVDVANSFYFAFGSPTRQVRIRRVRATYAGPLFTSEGSLSLVLGMAIPTTGLGALTLGEPFDSNDVSPTAGYTLVWTGGSAFNFGPSYAFTWIGDSYEWSWSTAEAWVIPAGRYLMPWPYRATTNQVVSGANHALAEFGIEWTE